jgi:hypothetical protein
MTNLPISAELIAKAAGATARRRDAPPVSSKCLTRKFTKHSNTLPFYV